MHSMLLQHVYLTTTRLRPLQEDTTKGYNSITVLDTKTHFYVDKRIHLTITIWRKANK